MTSRISPRGLMICIVLLLLATGLVAVQGFHRIGGIIVARLTESSRMMAAADQVLSALEEQERMLDRMLLSDEVSAPLETRNLEASLEAVRKRASEREPGHPSASPGKSAQKRIETAWEEYRQRLESVLELLANSPENARLRREKFLETSASLRRLRRAILDLLVAERAQTAATEETLRRVAFHFGLLIVVLTSVGMLVALGFHYRLTGLLIRPLERIGRFLDNVGAGLFDERLGLQRDPLVNRLAQSCNRLTTNLQDAAEESRRRVRVERNVGITLIETFSEPTVVITAGGDALLANTPARTLFEGEEGKERLEALQKAVRTHAETFTDGRGTTFRLRALTTDEEASPRLCFAVQVLRDKGDTARPSGKD